MEAGHRLIVETRLESSGAFRASYRRWIDKSKSSAEIEQIRHRTLQQLRDGSIAVEAPKELVWWCMLSTMTELAGEIHGMGWKLHIASGGEFVISDRPLTMFDPTPRFPWSGNGLRSSPTAFSMMPVGSEFCLRLDQDDERMAVRRAERMIERTNLRSYGWATTFVYGRSKDVLHQLHRVATENPARVERPRPSPQVVLEESDPDDPTVGSEHPPGWPRGLWARGDDGKQRYFAYELIDAD